MARIDALTQLAPRHSLSADVGCTYCSCCIKISNRMVDVLFQTFALPVASSEQAEWIAKSVFKIHTRKRLTSTRQVAQNVPSLLRKPPTLAPHLLTTVLLVCTCTIVHVQKHYCRIRCNELWIIYKILSSFQLLANPAFKSTSPINLLVASASLVLTNRGPNPSLNRACLVRAGRRLGVRAL